MMNWVNVVSVVEVEEQILKIRGIKEGNGEEHLSWESLLTKSHRQVTWD